MNQQIILCEQRTKLLPRVNFLTKRRRGGEEAGEKKKKRKKKEKKRLLINQLHKSKEGIAVNKTGWRLIYFCNDTYHIS